MKAEGAETEAAEANVGGASAAMLKAEAVGAAELKTGAAGAPKLKAEAAEAAEMEVGAAEATGAVRRDTDGTKGGNAEAAMKGSVERDWGEELAPAPVGAGEEAREESCAKKLAASSTADWDEVACPPADARESDSGSRGLKGVTGELDPEGYAFMPSRHECSPKSDIFKVPFFSMTLGPDFFRRQKSIFCNNFVRFSFLSIQT